MIAFQHAYTAAEADQGAQAELERVWNWASRMLPAHDMVGQRAELTPGPGGIGLLLPIAIWQELAVAWHQSQAVASEGAPHGQILH